MITVVPPAIIGKFGMGEMFNELHVDCSRFLIRPYSLTSIDRFQRTFIAIQLPKYVHVYDCKGGNQLDGSLSLFDWLTESVTASKVRLSDVSFANALRWAALHAQAPESHASFSATTWSISISEGLLHFAPS